MSLHFKYTHLEVQLTECLFSQVWLNTAVAGRHEVTVIISVKGDTTSTPAVKMILAVEMESPNVQVYHISIA